MKLARCIYENSVPFWGVVDIDQGEVNPIREEFKDWARRVTEGAGISAVSFSSGPLPIGDVVLLPPIEPVNRVVVAGANYLKHIQDDFALETPRQPIAFLKAYGALIGANDSIKFPSLTNELDYEVELVVVIGRERFDPKDPYASVLGYTVGNDVSARDLQRSGPKGIGMDLFAAKSQDKTTGLGPWIVTRDEFAAESPELRLTLSVNGDLRQDGNTSEMTWSVGELISFVQARSSFSCGDVLFTGSPAGVGMATGKFLKPGDVVEAAVEGIGALKNIVAERNTKGLEDE